MEEGRTGFQQALELRKGNYGPPGEKRHGGGVKEGPGASETCLLREGDWEWGRGLQRVEEVARGHGGARALPGARAAE